MGEFLWMLSAIFFLNFWFNNQTLVKPLNLPWVSRVSPSPWCGQRVQEGELIVDIITFDELTFIQVVIDHIPVIEHPPLRQVWQLIEPLKKWKPDSNFKDTGILLRPYYTRVGKPEVPRWQHHFTLSQSVARIRAIATHKKVTAVLNYDSQFDCIQIMEDCRYRSTVVVPRNLDTKLVISWWKNFKLNVHWFLEFRNTVTVSHSMKVYGVYAGSSSSLSWSNIKSAFTGRSATRRFLFGIGLQVENRTSKKRINSWCQRYQKDGHEFKFKFAISP